MERALDHPLQSAGRILSLPDRRLTSTSPSAIKPPPAVQRNPTWTSPASSAMDMFNFSNPASSSAVPSYAPVAGSSSNNNVASNSGVLGDMSFASMAAQYANRNPLQSVLSQGKDGHEAKRIKVESPRSALDSIDSWLQFDEEADKFGSFEIDFSKQYSNPASQPRPTTNMTPGLGSGLYANPTAPFREEDFLDDSAFDHSLSEDDDLFDSINMNDQLSKIETLPSTEPQSSRSLYSTPSLGWEKPQSGIHPSAVSMSDEIPRRMGSDAWDAIQQGTNYTLTAEERRRLLEIAMGPNRMSAFVSPNRFNMGYGATMQPSLSQEFGFGFGGPKQGINMFQRNNSADTTASGLSQSNRDLKHKLPKNDTPPKTIPAKRPSTQSETSSSLGKDKTKSADRMAHNDVERKYRTNLKDKITELRNAVPALQQATEGEPESAQGIAKVSKGTVLTKATEYIHQLEQRNKDIMSEHKQLMRRLQAFEALLNNSMRVDIMPSHSMTLFDPRGFC